MNKFSDYSYRNVKRVNIKTIKVNGESNQFVVLDRNFVDKQQGTFGNFNDCL